jgi:hypothetical protein
MKNKTMFLLLFLFGVFLTLGSVEARAQSGEPKGEVGGQVSIIRFRDLSSTDVGVGGWVSYDVSRYFSLDATVNVFPQDKMDPFASGRKAEGLFGIKTGFKSDKAGFYGKFRAGFMHFSRNFDTTPQGFNDFAMDFGGVLEIYPSRRTVFRVDLGDTFIKFGTRNIFVPGLGVIDAGHFNSHNFQGTVGFGFRF